ncbi:MAG: peptidoglycan editing factor PgeF [Ignavibacteria bacterium]|jgi:YfiH family protein
MADHTNSSILKPAIIRSEKFASFPNLVHGVSTKLGGNTLPPFFNNMSFKVGDDEERVRTNRNKFFSSLGIEQSNLAIPQQIHSDNVMIINTPGYYENTDALITSEKNVFLIISTADCYSILIYDKEREIVSAVHSGWRGTHKKILSKTANVLLNEIGCRKKDLGFFIGPGICRDHFDVGEDVAEMFDKKFINRKNEKYFIDFKEHILNQLHEIGISHSQIDVSPYCTYEEKDYLHSYRRDRTNSGRMFSVIGMRSPSLSS